MYNLSFGMDRRVFVSQIGMAAIASCTMRGPHYSRHSAYHKPLLSPDDPKALAMWDFSWLLRQYEGGGFEDWDKALDELMVRGYNAIRIDCFPQFVSEDDEGQTRSQIHLPKKGRGPTLWGNERSVDITPIESLLTFLDECARRDIYIVLSSWFYGHGTDQNKRFNGSAGLIRAWDQTLSLLETNGLLDNVLYVDVLNEYPLWHGYQWLHDQLESISPLDEVPFDFLNLSGERRYNLMQRDMYSDFINQVILGLKGKWPGLRFMASQTNTLNTPWKDLEIESFDVLDIHLWMIYNKQFSLYSDYFNGIHTLRNAHLYKTTQQKIHEYWSGNKVELTSWLSSSMKDRMSWADKYDIPLGCSEGWGAVMWMEHRDLDWSFIKETGLLAARLGVTHKYSFNCSSNFTHPHFTSLWQDIDWHREVTRTIRKL